MQHFISGHRTHYNDLKCNTRPDLNYPIRPAHALHTSSVQSDCNMCGVLRRCNLLQDHYRCIFTFLYEARCTAKSVTCTACGNHHTVPLLALQSCLWSNAILCTLSVHSSSAIICSIMHIFPFYKIMGDRDRKGPLV